jgi:hypothetical protein
MGQRELTAAGSGQTGQSSIPAVKPAVVKRLEYVITTLHQYVEQNDESGQMARFSFIAKAVIDEMTEELAERDEATLQIYMAQIGEVIAWVGHGDITRLPDNIRPFANRLLELEQAAS